MLDAFADSTALLERLVRQVTKETNPVQYDKLAAEIRHVLEERELLRDATALKERLNQKKQRRFGT